MLNKILSLSFLADAAAGADADTPTGGGWGSIILMVGVVVVMYLVLFLPQRKKEKQAKAMRDAIQPGDEVVTIGGIVGKVLKVKDDEVTIETGADKNRVVFKKWAINTVNNMTEVPKAQKKAVDDDDEEAYLDEYVEKEKKK